VRRFQVLTALGVEIQLLLPGYPKAIESAADKSVKVELAISWVQVRCG